jgi:DNA-binding beta-propeller fold protein YncE
MKALRNLSLAVLSALAALLALAATSCDVQSTGDLIVSLESDLPRSIAAEMPAPASYLLTGEGPSGSQLYVDSDSALFSLRGLSAGVWSIEALVTDADGLSIAAGSVEVNVRAGVQNDVVISCLPDTGMGSLALTVVWPEGAVSDPVLAVELEGIDEYNWELRPDPGEHRVSELLQVRSGHYLFRLSLETSTESLGAFVESLWVLPDRELDVGVTFAESGSGLIGSLEGSVSILPAGPVDLRIEPLLSRSIVGDALDLEAAGATTWFVNGIEAGAGPSLSRSFEEGSYRVSALARGPDNRLGLASMVIEVFHPPDIAGFRFLDLIADGEQGAEELRGARGLAGSPDGRRLAVAGYNDDGVVVFELDEANYRLTNAVSRGGSSELDGVSDLLFLDGEHLLAAAARSGLVNLYGVSEDAIDLLWSFEDGLQRPVALAKEPASLGEGHRIWIADETAGKLLLLQLSDPPGGSPSLLGSYDLAALAGTAPGSLSPSGIAVSPDSGELAVSSWDADVVILFRMDGDAGLIHQQSLSDGVDGPLNAPADLAFGRNGEDLYISSYYDDAVLHFVRNGLSDPRSLLSTVEDGAGGVSGLNGARGLSLWERQSGDAVLAVAGSVSDGVAFLGGQSGGELAFLGSTDPDPAGPAGLDGARSLVFFGGDLFVASSNSGTLAHFRKP